MLKRISNKTYEEINALGYDAVVSKRDGLFGIHIGKLDATNIIVSFSGVCEDVFSDVEPTMYEIGNCYVDGLKPLIKGFKIDNNNDLINLIIVIKNFMENK